jgi:hypothetical protein
MTLRRHITMADNNRNNNSNFILSTDLKPGYDTAEPTQTKKEKYIKIGIAVGAIALFLLMVIL